MRCPICMLDTQETVLIGTLAQHTCRRCNVFLAEGLDGRIHIEDLLKAMERIIKEADYGKRTK